MNRDERSPGWTLFASITIGIVGAWHEIVGVAAVTEKRHFDEASLLYQNLSFWSVVWIVIGALQLLTAVLVARRTAVGQALGLIGASVSMFVWFFALDTQPIASVLIVVLDVLILYALTADRTSTSAPTPDRYDARAAEVPMSPGPRFG